MIFREWILPSYLGIHYISREFVEVFVKCFCEKKSSFLYFKSESIVEDSIVEIKSRK